ncbi:MAG TPA: outer membrane protein assembly factor BamA [Geminicoccaceae bacterium]|jgi:outer membrane protein insertion porin family|nr:outer membrane protein assembly factor BamA [Geminicoccaceae bacterium]
MPRLAVLVATVGLLLAIAGAWTALRAQQGALPSPTDVIRQIEVEGNQRIEATTVRSYLAVAVGDPFDPAALDQSLKNLFATGLFDDVTLRREGDTLVVAVVENPIINRIAFEGNRRLEDDVLESELQLRPRVVYTRSRVQNAVSRILELYRRNGRFAATVEPKVIELPQNRVDLVFEINEGPLTKVARIVFIGNREFDDGDLRDVIQTREAAWYRFLTSDDTYDPDRLAFDQELLRRFYLARGYADFNVRSAIAELTPDGRRFVVTFTVEEGERYNFGQIDIESRIPDLEPEQLRELVETRTGDVYNADQVEDSIVALTEEIGELGYAFAEVEPVPQKREDQRTIDLNYVINEGSRVYIERIDIVGNVRTLDEVIRREFRVSEGDAFNTALLRRSRQRIENLGYFESVELNTLPGSSPDKTRIEVAVSERSTGELSFGAGYSTSDGPLGDIRLSERNLLGRGQSIQANFTVSARTQEIDFGFTEPYFLDREVAAGFDLFRRSTDFQSEGSFDQRTTGGTLRASYPLTERWQHGVRLTVREDAIKDVDNNASEFIKDEQGSALTVLLGQTFTYDARDQRFLPTEGYILSLDQDVADFGAETQFARVEGRASYYYPFTPNWVLNVAGRGGYIVGLGEDVRLFDRFFLGGASFRGFKFAGVGPRDTSTGDALGGKLLYTGTVEQRFPLGLPEELRIFGRAFVDAGSLSDPDVSGANVFDSSAIRASAGGGISWLSPLGPIAIDLAHAFLKEDEDETELFRLSFGTRF